MIDNTDITAEAAEPLETERKFLIEYPDTALLESAAGCRKYAIEQTYINLTEGFESRVRKRESVDGVEYFLTEKKKITDVTRVENERKITLAEYEEYLTKADETRHPVVKTRYGLTYKNQYFEIDVYPMWNDKAIVEIELESENAPIEFPHCIRVIREVTGEEKYKNSSLAKL